MKKIYFMGEIYDFAQQTPLAIAQNIEKRIKEFTGQDIPVVCKILSNKEIEVTINRRYGQDARVEMSPGMIFQFDSFLISGEGYQGFVPEYNMHGHPNFPNMHYYYGNDQFLDCYRKNAQHYGASRIAGAEIESTDNYLKLKIRF